MNLSKFTAQSLPVIYHIVPYSGGEIFGGELLTV